MNTPRAVRTHLVAMLFAAGSVVPALGQAQGAMLIGFVKDDLGRPLEGAEVRVRGRDQAVLSDADGRFRIANVPVGLLDIGARRIGFLPLADLIRFTPTDTVQFTLDHIGQRLDTVRVQRRADASWERDLRRFASAVDASRFGTVTTERDIDERHAQFTTDLLQNTSGFVIIGSGSGASVLSTRGRCAPTLFLDGLALPGYPLNNVSTRSIKLMVVYRDGVTMAPELLSVRANPACGAISITTM